MTRGQYNTDYFDERVKLAHLYSTVGLDVSVFLGAFHQMMRAVGVAIMEDSKLPPLAAFDAFMSLKKVAFLDISIIVDVLIDERERVISAQQDALRELSTPVLQLRDRLLVLPIIGMIDTLRARQLTDGLLVAIRNNRASRVLRRDLGAFRNVPARLPRAQ
jgi:rsbT co-antagonist protein RsbR